jgi:hypothetical protein
MSDPEEFIGSDRSIKADPKPVKPKPDHAETRGVRVKQNGEPMASHPKHAIAGPAKEYAAAQQETEAARIEYQSAMFSFNSAEDAESAARDDWVQWNPPPTQDEVYRAHVARGQDQRAANVAAGLPPRGIKPVTHDKSPLGIAAANRPRQTPQMPSTPLRSPVARRWV